MDFHPSLLGAKQPGVEGLWDLLLLLFVMGIS